MTAASGTDPATDNQPIKGTLQGQLKFIRTTLGDSSNLIVREMILSTGARCAVAYIEGITDSLLLYPSRRWTLIPIVVCTIITPSILAI